MIFLNIVFKIEPWVTPMAVRVLVNHNTVSIEKAGYLLGYEPEVDFHEGIKRVESWLRKENYIP